VPQKPEEPFTLEDLEQACDDLELLKYPKTMQRAAIMRLFRNMVPHKRALRWLVGELVNQVGEWPGSAEVRGLLCTRFDPADGIDRPYCNIAGYTAEEAETKHIARHDQLKRLN
jgi:hypothetical protein